MQISEADCKVTPRTSVWVRLMSKTEKRLGFVDYVDEEQDSGNADASIPQTP